VVELPLVVIEVSFVVSVLVVDWVLVTAVTEPDVDIEDVVEGPFGVVVVLEEASREVVAEDLPVPVETLDSTVVVFERVVELQAGP
jgi:hypothetical protein